MRICYLMPEIDQQPRPGPSAIVWDMAQELVLMGHQAHVITPQPPSFPIDQRIHLHYFPVPPFANRWFLGQIWLSKRIVDVVKVLDVDIIHSPEYLSAAVLASLYHELPIVLTTPGNIFQRLAMPDGNQSSFLFTETIKWAARVSAQKCDTVIAFTTEMRKWWIRTGSDPERTPVIPYGVDTSHYYYRENSRTYLGLPQDTLIFLYVGRLDKEKGLFDLIDAIQQVRSVTSLTDVRFDFIGDGPLKSALLRKITEYKLQHIIHLHGSASRQELPFWYSAADMLILPSWIEPFGRVILESMACGTPVLATRTDGPIDHIKPNENGFLCDPRDATELANYIVKVIHQPAVLTEMGKRAKNYVQENLSWKRIVSRIVNEVYNPLLIDASPDHKTYLR